MIYEVEGGNKAQRKVVDTAMSYVIQLLNIPSRVHVEIVLGNFKSHSVMHISKYYYEMEIVKSVSAEEIAYTVFHEMKHVEQLVHERLVHDGRNIYWEGVDHTETEYFECPWEKEAYKFEKSADLMLTRIAA